jgi:hypothetical protein
MKMAPLQILNVGTVSFRFMNVGTIALLIQSRAYSKD